MSLLPPEFHSALSLLLQSLVSPDNNVRSQAETQLNDEWVAKRPDILLMGLVEQMRGSEDSQVGAILI
jgi:importin-5